MLNVFIGFLGIDGKESALEEVGIDGTESALEKEMRKQKVIQLAAEHKAKQEEMQRQQEKQRQKEIKLAAEKKAKQEEMQRQKGGELAASLKEKNRLALELQEQEKYRVALELQEKEKNRLALELQERMRLDAEYAKKRKEEIAEERRLLAETLRKNAELKEFYRIQQEEKMKVIQQEEKMKTFLLAEESKRQAIEAEKLKTKEAQEKQVLLQKRQMKRIAEKNMKKKHQEMVDKQNIKQVLDPKDSTDKKSHKDLKQPTALLPHANGDHMEVTMVANETPKKLKRTCEVVETINEESYSPATFDEGHSYLWNGETPPVVIEQDEEPSELRKQFEAAIARIPNLIPTLLEEIPQLIPRWELTPTRKHLRLPGHTMFIDDHDKPDNKKV